MTTTRVRAGRYEATDQSGNEFLIKRAEGGWEVYRTFDAKTSESFDPNVDDCWEITVETKSMALAWVEGV